MINVWIRTAIADGSIKMGDKNVPMYKIRDHFGRGKTMAAARAAALAADPSYEGSDTSGPFERIQHPKFGWQTEEIIKLWGAK